MPQPDGEKLYRWRLVAINGRPCTARALIACPDDRTRIARRGPCDRFTATRVTAPFPTGAVTGITATEIACGDLAAERQRLAALARMQRRGIGVPCMVNDAGRRLDFVPASP
jgi:hypothetical protein